MRQYGHRVACASRTARSASTLPPHLGHVTDTTAVDSMPMRCTNQHDGFRCYVRDPVKHFVPHAVIMAAILALAAGTLPETACLVLLAAGHLAVPVWSATRAEQDRRARAILLGPGTV